MIMMLITQKDFAKCRDYTPPLYGVRNSPLKLYLTGTLDSWNNSKRSEELDRVKHDIGEVVSQQKEKEDLIASILGVDMIQNVTGIERDCCNQVIHQEVYEPAYAIA